MLEAYQAVNGIVLQPASALEELKLYEEKKARRSASQTLYHPACGSGCTAGGQEIVHNDHAFARTDGIAVKLQHVGAVLQSILFPDLVGGKLALFAGQRKAQTEFQRDGRPPSETRGTRYPECGPA